MKGILLIPMLFLYGLISAQDLDGSWKLTEKNGKPVEELEKVKIYQDGYFAFGTKETGTNIFLNAGGGKYSIENGYSESYDFNSAYPVLVGTTKNYRLRLENDRLTLESSEGTEVWERIGNDADDLSGNWIITGRKRDGEIKTSTPGARRTIKILGGGKFQWAAFNSETKEFLATGGGNYTAENGTYTENIQFFSRDDSRVGANLEFDYQVKEGNWHHSGKSSKGEPMYEIWSPYDLAYKAE